MVIEDDIDKIETRMPELMNYDRRMSVRMITQTLNSDCAHYHYKRSHPAQSVRQAVHHRVDGRAKGPPTVFTLSLIFLNNVIPGTNHRHLSTTRRRCDRVPSCTPLRPLNERRHKWARQHADCVVHKKFVLQYYVDIIERWRKRLLRVCYLRASSSQCSQRIREFQVKHNLIMLHQPFHSTDLVPTALCLLFD